MCDITTLSMREVTTNTLVTLPMNSYNRLSTITKNKGHHKVQSKKKHKKSKSKVSLLFFPFLLVLKPLYHFILIVSRKTISVTSNMLLLDHPLSLICWQKCPQKPKCDNYNSTFCNSSHASRSFVGNIVPSNNPSRWMMSPLWLTNQIRLSNRVAQLEQIHVELRSQPTVTHHKPYY